MAKRMLNDEVICSDAFLVDLSNGAQRLYFYLNMDADDDGFVSSPKKIVRMIGAKSKELEELIERRFLIAFESGRVVIKHWLIHNTLRADRYKPTVYQEEYKTLEVKENKAYTELNKAKVTNGIPSDNQMATQIRLDKIRLDKDTMSEKSDAPTPFDQFYKAYPKKELKKKAQEIWNRKKLDDSVSEILVFIAQAKNTDRWLKGFVKQPTTFLTNESWNDDLSAYGDAKSPPEKSGTAPLYRDFSKDPLI